MDAQNFDDVFGGEIPTLLKLKNSKGIEALLTTYGCRVISLKIPLNKNEFREVILGYDKLSDYINDRSSAMGATVGRYANRIGNATFSLEKQKYNLVKNNGPNCLHGGVCGFDIRFWLAQRISDSRVDMFYFSPDMEEGFPGNMNVHAILELSDDAELSITYKATTDKTTIINLTNHMYFNFQTDQSEKIFDHELQIFAENTTPVSKHMIPTGEISPVKNTPFDFTSLKRIGKDFNKDSEQLSIGQGYDHNFVLDRTNLNDLVLAAKLNSSDRLIRMDLHTNQPGLQFYTSNFLPDPYGVHRGICLEPQIFPDSPNREGFPNAVLHPGEDYEWRTVYRLYTSEK